MSNNSNMKYGFELPTKETFNKEVEQLEKWELVKYLGQAGYFWGEINYIPAPTLFPKLLAAAKRAVCEKKIGDICIIKQQGVQKAIEEEKTGIILDIYQGQGHETYLLDIGGEKIKSDSLVNEFVGMSIEGIW